MMTKEDETLGETEMGREDDGEVVVVEEAENGRTEKTDEVEDACHSAVEAVQFGQYCDKIDVEVFLGQTHKWCERCKRSTLDLYQKPWGSGRAFLFQLVQDNLMRKIHTLPSKPSASGAEIFGSSTLGRPGSSSQSPLRKTLHLQCP